MRHRALRFVAVFLTALLFLMANTPDSSSNTATTNITHTSPRGLLATINSFPLAYYAERDDAKKLVQQDIDSEDDVTADYEVGYPRLLGFDDDDDDDDDDNDDDEVENQQGNNKYYVLSSDGKNDDDYDGEDEDNNSDVDTQAEESGALESDEDYTQAEESGELESDEDYTQVEGQELESDEDDTLEEDKNDYE